MKTGKKTRDWRIKGEYKVIKGGKGYIGEKEIRATYYNPISHFTVDLKEKWPQGVRGGYIGLALGFVFESQRFGLARAEKKIRRRQRMREKRRNKLRVSLYISSYFLHFLFTRFFNITFKRHRQEREAVKKRKPLAIL